MDKNTPQPLSADIFNGAVNYANKSLVNGSDVSTIIDALATTSAKPMIAGLKAQGWSDGDIVADLVGHENYKKTIDARTAGSLETAAKGAGDVLGDVGRSWKQGYSYSGGYDPAAMNSAKQAQADAEAAPDRQVRDTRPAAQVGRFAVKVAPNIAAAALTGGASLPLQAAVQGGTSALSTAITDPHATGGDIALSGALGAAAVPAAAGLSKLATSALSKAGASAANRAADIEAKAAAPALAAQAQAAKAASAAADAERVANTSTAFKQKVAEKVGLPGWEGDIDTSLVNAASKVAKDGFEAASGGKAVQVPKGFTSFVRDTAENDLENTGKAVQHLIDKTELRSGTFVSAKKWIEMRSKVGALARNAEGADAHYLGNIVERMDDAMAAGRTPEQVATLTQAREVWKNLQPVEDMVKKSGNSGNVTWQNFKTSISKDVDKYSRGAAPLQDLEELARQLQPQGKLLDKLDELKAATEAANAKAASAAVPPTNGAGKVAGGLLLDAIPFGNTVANIAGKAANPAVLRGVAGIANSGANLANNKLASQILGQLAARGVGAR